MFVIARAIVKIQILKGKIMNFPIFDEKKLRGLSIHNCGRSQAPPNLALTAIKRQTLSGTEYLQKGVFYAFYE